MTGSSGFDLGDIANVQIDPATVANGDQLVYSASAKRWVNSPMLRAVSVTADWATAANAKADIESATGMTFPADTALLDIFVTLWEGEDDPDDFAVLLVKETPEYTAQNGLACEFTSEPASGTAYIVGLSINPVLA